MVVVLEGGEGTQHQVAAHDVLCVLDLVLDGTHHPRVLREQALEQRVEPTALAVAGSAAEPGRSTKVTCGQAVQRDLVEVRRPGVDLHRERVVVPLDGGDPVSEHVVGARHDPRRRAVQRPALRRRDLLVDRGVQDRLGDTNRGAGVGGARAEQALFHQLVRGVGGVLDRRQRTGIGEGAPVGAEDGHGADQREGVAGQATALRVDGLGEGPRGR